MEEMEEQSPLDYDPEDDLTYQSLETLLKQKQDLETEIDCIRGKLEELHSRQQSLQKCCVEQGEVINKKQKENVYLRHIIRILGIVSIGAIVIVIFLLTNVVFIKFMENPIAAKVDSGDSSENVQASSDVLRSEPSIILRLLSDGIRFVNEYSTSSCDEENPPAP
mgnify:CR=1 FL=1